MWTINDHVWCDAAQKHNRMLIVFTNIHPLGSDQEPFGSMPFDQIPCTICIASDLVGYNLYCNQIFCIFAAFSHLIHLCFTDSSIIVCSTWLSFMSLSSLFIGIIYTVQFCLTQRSTKTKRYLKQLADSGSHLVTFRKFNLPWYVIYKLPNTTRLIRQWTYGGLNALKHYHIPISVTWFYLPFFFLHWFIVALKAIHSTSVHHFYLIRFDATSQHATTKSESASFVSCTLSSSAHLSHNV